MKNAPSHRRALAAVALPLTLLALGEARAADLPPHPAPPPEAYSACANGAAGDACSVTFEQRTIQGACAASETGQLFCRPTRPPLPPEAFTACASKASSEACTVTLGDQSLQGACAAAEDGRLFCRLERPPPGR